MGGDGEGRLGLLGLVLGRERRTLHDLVAGTVVVYDWGERQAEQPVSIRDQLSARVRRRQDISPRVPATPMSRTAFPGSSGR